MRTINPDRAEDLLNKAEEDAKNKFTYYSKIANITIIILKILISNIIVDTPLIYKKLNF